MTLQDKFDQNRDDKDLPDSLQILKPRDESFAYEEWKTENIYGLKQCASPTGVTSWLDSIKIKMKFFLGIDLYFPSYKK